MAASFFKLIVKYLYLISIVCLSSCVSTKNANYFSNVRNNEFPDQEIIPVIQNNDLLGINVSSLNPEATIIFNVPAQTAGLNPPIAPGYLVNREGNIKFPVLGSVKATGLTLEQFSENLSNILVQKKLLIDPIVSTRLLNFRVTVLGEVARPSVIPVTNEKISLLEALGMAGDLTIFGKRNNLLLIRVEDGKRIARRINLNDSNMFISPYYYLKTNDIIYVEPNQAKVATSRRLTHLAPIIVSSLSFVAIILNIFIK